MLNCMKELLWLLLLVGCVNHPPIPSVTVVAGLDFSRYTVRGFFFSPDPYSGPHDMKGLVTVRRYSSARYVDSLASWEYGPVGAQEALDSVYARSVAMGADAFVRTEFQPVELPATPTTPRLPGIQITGYAIKRRQ